MRDPNTPAALQDRLAGDEAGPRIVRRMAGPLAAIAVAAVLYSQASGTSSVSGVVKLDGQPLEGVLVCFHPRAGGSVAEDTTDEEGRYSLSAGENTTLASGEYQVTIGDPEESAVSGDDTIRDEHAAKLPLAKYAAVETSGLRANVRWGQNEINFNLRSRDGRNDARDR